MIEVPGYTADEKHHIAMRHVVPRVLEEHGRPVQADRLNLGLNIV